ELLQQERERFTERHALPLLNAVNPDGTFDASGPAQYRGRWVKDCDDEIMAELTERGIMLLQETVKHEYPFCPRSEDDPLIQYARKSWFVRTSKFKEEFLKNNDGILWLPEHIREGRFGDFLRNNVDWALSRERYWGTPLPIWVCEKTGKMEAIGSYTELLAKPGVQGTEVWEKAKAADPELPEHLKVHKPYIDAITYDSPFDEGRGNGEQGTGEGEAPAEPRKKARMRRVPEVIDCWWDAGSMPFAQWGFPHVEGSVESFAQRFPCDFISEAIDQTRGWFYGLLAISTLLFSSASETLERANNEGGTGVPPVSHSEEGGVGVSPASRSKGVTAELAIRRRRKLPHWEAGGSTYFVTFRTATAPTGGRPVDLTPEQRTVVLNTCRHWDGERLLLHAVVVMPDHVHLLLTPLDKEAGVWWSLSELLHSIKGYSTKEINKRRSQSRGEDWRGTVWQDERYDRIIRDQSDFDEKWEYIVSNPQRRGLPDDYAWLWVEPADSGGGRDAHPTLPARTYPQPYKTCIVLGHVMGEDGLKMSKRTGNYKEPDYIFDHYGADAMRWYFFSAQTPWTSIRFQEAAIRDAQREFLVRLYNVFSFFNIYANIDGFAVEGSGIREQGTGRNPGVQAPDPRSPIPGPGGTGWRPVSQRSEIDRWISSELHRTVRSVRDAMDRFENFPAAGRLNDFVDALSNWYVRRSRDRFWRPVDEPRASARAVQSLPESASPRGLKSAAPFSAQDQDKWDAYNTLYEVLVTLSKLIAPFTPFFAETMYQNLVRHEGTKARRHGGGGQSSALPDRAPISVHLCDYPEPDAALIDEKLAQDMDLVRQIVSTGRAARTAARLKVRQPLAQVEIILAWRDYEERLKAHTELIAEELNVKKVEFTHEAEHYVRYRVKPNFKVIGPKFGHLAPEVDAALRKLDDPASARKTLLSDDELSLSVDGQTVRLSREDVEIRLEAKEGWSAAQGKAGVVVVSTELTPQLREEGLMRELIHHVQGLRKQQDLAYEARITLYITASGEFLEIVRRFTDTIGSECLARRIEFAAPPSGDMMTTKIEEHEVKLAIQTV
ncbi:MAG: class I tRNA ligase family protein, partial [Phycisphaerae bacterium]